MSMKQSTGFARRTGHFLALATALALTLSAPVLAQGSAPASPTELKNRVDECFDRVKGVSQITRATLTFEIGEAGALVATPQKTSIYGKDEAAQKLADEGIKAVTTCAPYGFVPGTYTVTLAPNGVAGAVPYAARRAYTAHLASTRPASAALKLGGQPVTAETRGSAVSEAQEAALDLGRDVRREIQVRLGLAGHSTGGADGMFGPATRAAITAWQSARGLPVSGFIDMAQLDRLRTETAVAYASRPAPEPTYRASTPRSTAEPAPQTTLRKVKVCQRDIFGQLVNCRIEYR